MAKLESVRPGARASLRRTRTGATGRSKGVAFSQTLLAVAISGAFLTSVTPAVAAPQNPDDAAISQAETDVVAGDGEVARLAGSISDTDAEINRVELEMGALREEVNKSLVDLHDAQAVAEQARQDAKAAKAELDGTQEEIEAAQERLNEISRAAYRQNGTSKGLSGISGNGNSEDALDRQTYLRTTAEKQQAAVEELDRLRTEQANKESALRQARVIAEQREAEATEKQRQTEAAIAANSEQLNVLNSNRTTLVAQRGEAERNLAAARANVETLQGQRKEYEEFQKAEEARKKAEAEAQAAAEEKRQAEEAAAKAQAAADAARASQAEANDRAAAQQHAEEAQAAAEQAQAEADARATNDAEAQALRDNALAAASAAAAALIAAGQADHATTDNPYPSGEDAEAGDIAEVQAPTITETDDETEPETGESVEIPETVEVPESTDTSTGSQNTAPTTPVVSGNREALIETAISRGMSQLGMPYAWGGGNANGPTLGIRDGGVADSYGDYNKIGFDCSGLVLYAFAGVGISLPHYTGYQYQHGTKVSPSEMQRGDLIFYGPGASQHVAIYLGDGQMLEAPASGSVVKVSPVRWSGMTESAVRLL